MRKRAMNTKCNLCFWIIGLFLPAVPLPRVSTAATGQALTVDQLADICEQLESSITDISVEYDWLNIPPWTPEEAEKEMGMPMLIPKDGRRRFKLTAAGLLAEREPNSPLPNRFLVEEATTLITKEGNSWDNLSKKSYNGSIGKSLNIGGWPQEVREGIVSPKRPSTISLTLTPLGFSILRFSMSEFTEYKPLSTVLRREGLTAVDNTIQKIGDFNTIRADILQESTKVVWARIYFSVDHSYTAVRYEFMNGGNIAFVFEVHSLEQVGEGLWFPSSGRIVSPDDSRSDVFIATSPIVVNQGLTEKDFDIEFPPGTKVRDKIQDKEYIVPE